MNPDNNYQEETNDDSRDVYDTEYSSYYDNDN